MVCQWFTERCCGTHTTCCCPTELWDCVVVLIISIAGLVRYGSFFAMCDDIVDVSFGKCRYTPWDLLDAENKGAIPNIAYLVAFCYLCCASIYGFYAILFDTSNKHAFYYFVVMMVGFALVELLDFITLTACLEYYSQDHNPAGLVIQAKTEQRNYFSTDIVLMMLFQFLVFFKSAMDSFHNHVMGRDHRPSTAPAPDEKVEIKTEKKTETDAKAESAEPDTIDDVGAYDDKSAYGGSEPFQKQDPPAE